VASFTRNKRLSFRLSQLTYRYGLSGLSEHMSGGVISE